MARQSATGKRTQEVRSYTDAHAKALDTQQVDDLFDRVCFTAMKGH